VKTITLDFEERTFARIRSAMAVRMLACEAAGLLDALVMKIVNSVEAGEARIEIKQKKEID
jgi:hypothetical protein